MELDRKNHLHFIYLRKNLPGENELLLSFKKLIMKEGTLNVYFIRDRGGVNIIKTNN
jgi:hypothetical protein